MPEDQPNVLFVFADQLRAEAVGCLGNSQVETPNIDTVADEGTLFENAYTVDPVCAPARGSILTGCYPHTHRVITNKLRLPTTRRTIAHHFRDAGYQTGYVGKWHLDGKAEPGFVPPGPRRQGFDYWEGFNRGHDHHRGHPRFTDEGDLYWEEGYQPDVQTDLATDFIRDHRSDPFCLFLSWGPPHTPFDAPDEYREMYSRDDLDVRPNVPNLESIEARRENYAQYYGMVSSLDHNLGRLMTVLEEQGIADDTIVCFTSDHGEMLGSKGRYRKGVPYEESIHVPLLVRYPRAVRDQRSTDPVSLVDLMPTLLSLCDIHAPEHVQGHDRSALLRGETDDGPDSVYIEGRLPWNVAWRALRTDRYMIAVDEALRTQFLFDMEDDPYQMRNLAYDDGARDLELELRNELIEKVYATDDRRFMAKHIHNDRYWFMAHHI